MKFIFYVIVVLILVGFGMASSVMYFFDSGAKNRYFREFYKNDYKIQNPKLLEVYNDWMIEEKNTLDKSIQERLVDYNLYEKKKAAGVESAWDKPWCIITFSKIDECNFWKDEQENTKKMLNIYEKYDCISEEINKNLQDQKDFYDQAEKRDFIIQEKQSICNRIATIADIYTKFGDDKNYKMAMKKYKSFGCIAK